MLVSIHILNDLWHAGLAQDIALGMSFVVDLAKSWCLVDLARHGYRLEEMKQRSEGLFWIMDHSILLLPFLIWSGVALLNEEIA